ncbi:MAG: GntR family transcriptional regulator [Candidatus Rokubacteria bacterium]|nr:GntR family transcriptional regulator [Candidatus Rokubacteria bacterium]
MNERVPRYLQIAESLRERIQGGTLARGGRLANQRALAREFGVALMTLRQALELLEKDGLIRRRHGLGTFVASRSIDYDILHFRTFAGDLSARGEVVETHFLGSQFMAPDRRVSQGLGLPEGEAVFVLDRLRLVDQRPMSYQRSFLPASIGREVAKADLAVTPLRNVLRFKLGIEVIRARETVYAVTLRRQEASRLGCPPGSPAFRSERISWAADGAPVVFDRVFIPGDRFRITRELRYEGPRP